MPSGDSRRVVGRKIDMGGDFEANRIYAPHSTWSTRVGRARCAVAGASRRPIGSTRVGWRCCSRATCCRSARRGWRLPGVRQHVPDAVPGRNDHRRRSDRRGRARRHALTGRGTNTGDGDAAHWKAGDGERDHVCPDRGRQSAAHLRHFRARCRLLHLRPSSLHEAAFVEHVPADLGTRFARRQRPRALALVAVAAGQIEATVKVALLGDDLRVPQDEAVRVEEAA
jgi:hypothetical protein